MKLHLPSRSNVTLIENTFIDQYMPNANGDYVKLYLYLLRCAGAGTDLSISSIADVFELTEKDVRRALSYWEKRNLLSLSYGEDGSISEIRFLDGSVREGKVSSKTLPFKARGNSCVSAEKEPLPPQDEDEEQLRQVFFVAEQYYARPLSTKEQEDLQYYYYDLHFSPDLIEFLLEYCISVKSENKISANIASYVDKVAMDWARSGISTVDEAREHVKLFREEYREILRCFGIYDRDPAPVEIKQMDKWLEEYGFSLAVIREACNRTILKIHKPSLDYAEKILRSWYEAGARDLEDIKVLDEDYTEQKKEQKAEIEKERQQSAARRASRTVVPNRFNSFPQRDYDWNELEQQLLYTEQKKEG